MKRFADRIAVVCGGGSGIGEAAAKAFFAEGASVVIVDSNAEGAERVARELGSPDRVAAIALDISDRDQVRAMMQAAAERFGHLDVLVNSAGIRGVGSVIDVEPEQWHRVHRVNLEGTLNTAQAFAQIVIKSGRPASIVNVTSVGGLLGVPNRAAYVSSKHAIVGLTKEMAIEVGRQGIRVNAVAPGMIRTPMTEVMFVEPGGTERIRAAHAIGREGRAEEVAAAILFLASDEASFVTGAILPVDGGYTAGKGW